MPNKNRGHLTRKFASIEKTVDFDKERSIRVRFNFDNIFGRIAVHRPSNLVGRKKYLTKATFSCIQKQINYN